MGNGVEHCGEVVAQRGGFDVVDCQQCGFKHVVPIPTDEELRERYTHEYYDNEKPFYIEHYRKDEAWWSQVYRDRYALFAENLQSGEGSKQGHRVLDIGSGPGLFLEEGRALGWQTQGVEPSRQAAEYCQNELNLDVINGYMTAALAERLGRYDVINMSLVLEHLADPMAMLEIARGLLTDGGLLCVVVPNDFNPFQKILNEEMGFEPWWVAPPHHINYFDHATLKGVFEKMGFEVVHQGSTFPIDIFLLMGENYVGNDEVGAQCHNRRKQLEMNLVGHQALSRALSESFANIGLGREVVMIGRRR